MKRNLLLSLVLIMVMTSLTWAQNVPVYDDVEPSRFDYGKMWTLENAPLDYFEETYGFRPDDEWLEHARMSALRFSTYCSASFVSPQGLVMTNHHCSRDEVGKVMKEGEDFDQNGFYAPTLEEERKVEGLFVKQLVQIVDVTDTVLKAMNEAETDEAAVEAKQATLQLLIEKYGTLEGWEGLEIEPVTYYSGGRYSLYGYKKYDDVRLVLFPELDLGSFGGDFDNFTYPRYSLDCTFWRVYEDGKPKNTTDFYFKFNVDGVKDGEAVFVIGNPGSTERYRTMAQLEYDRDYRYKVLLKWLENRVELMSNIQKEEPTRDRQNMIANLANSVKAINGIQGGMYDPYLMGKKQAMENMIKEKSGAVAKGNDYWQQMADAYKVLEPHAAESILLGPSSLNGKTLSFAHMLYQYVTMKESGAGEEDLNAIKEQLMSLSGMMSDPYEVKYLTTLFTELKEFAGDKAYVMEILDGHTPAKAAKMLLNNTKLMDADQLEKFLAKKVKKIKKSKDPVVKMAFSTIPVYNDAVMAFKSSSAERSELGRKISNEVYNVYGLSIPPDATFTTRLADGVVKSYDYNGTKAPIYTTYFGLYNRYYGFNKEFPWSLPEKWENPPMELLKTPLNFISTNDIIGGNSGSPLINKKGEAVGLAFDGNIESLPGNFIFDEKVNRTVSVHTGAIVAAMKYIYKADRLVHELTGE